MFRKGYWMEEGRDGACLGKVTGWRKVKGKFNFQKERNGVRMDKIVSEKVEIN